MWKVKDFSLSGGSACKGLGHPGLVPGQQQLGIKVETDEKRVRRREKRGAIVAREGAGGDVTRRGSPSQGRSRTGSTCSWLTFKHGGRCFEALHKVCRQRGRSLQSSPRGSWPSGARWGQGNPEGRATPPPLTSFCIHVANGSPCSKWGLSSVIKCSRFRNNCGVTVKPNSHEVKSLLNFCGLKLLHRDSDVQCNGKLRTVYAQKSPLGGSHIPRLKDLKLWSLWSQDLLVGADSFWRFWHFQATDPLWLALMQCQYENHPVWKHQCLCSQSEFDPLPHRGRTETACRHIPFNSTPKAPKHYFLICSELFSTLFLPNYVAEHRRQCGENKPCLLHDWGSSVIIIHPPTHLTIVLKD